MHKVQSEALNHVEAKKKGDKKTKTKIACGVYPEKIYRGLVIKNTLRSAPSGTLRRLVIKHTFRSILGILRRLVMKKISDLYPLVLSGVWL